VWVASSLIENAMASQKPDDRRHPRPLGFEQEDSFVGNAPKAGSKPIGETAPEVSQGLWRERAFVPRGTMAKDEILHALQAAVDDAVKQSSHPQSAPQQLFATWLPVLRQVLEQFGGDGVDAWLFTTLGAKKTTAHTTLFETLAQCIRPLLSVAPSVDLTLLSESVIGLVKTATQTDRPARLSFKQMERQLEGKLEVHELLFVRAADDIELNRRLVEILSAMETLRSQLKSMPGKQPDGMYSNFVRLKSEARLIDAELKRRAMTAA
jgi:hypothetical protein